MNVTHLLTADESALLEAYRRSCAGHQEHILVFAAGAVDVCISGRTSFAGCARRVAPEPARPRPARLTLVKS